MNLNQALGAFLVLILASGCGVVRSASVDKSVTDQMSTSQSATVTTDQNTALDQYSDQAIQFHTYDDDTVRAQLMDSELPKLGEGAAAARPIIASSLTEEQKGDLIDLRDAVRAGINPEIPGRAGIGVNDNAADIIEQPIVSNAMEKLRQQHGDKIKSTGDYINQIRDIETARLTEGKVAVSPWSDDYWPTYQGQLAKRYADAGWVSTSDQWKPKTDYVLRSLLGSNQVNSSSVDNLSPAEKYDLLLGDFGYSLTRNQAFQGKSYYDKEGKVETWMGICHGWAPAAYMMDRPTKFVELAGANGVKIRFYPADIKALATLLWANQSYNSSFVGNRCDNKKPAKDANGRIKDGECFDNNPGTWTMAVVNQIGLARKSFVMDATFDYEVWNQPVYSYKIVNFFNPQNGKKFADMGPQATACFPGATIPACRNGEIPTFTNDKFRGYRSKQAQRAVGIVMDVTYIAETEPNHLKTNGPANDAKETVRYVYDLELNGNGVIVGGEWYSNAHPDFLWSPTPGMKISTTYDSGLNANEWNSSASPIPARWLAPARSASTRGLPLASIIYRMIQFAN